MLHQSATTKDCDCANKPVEELKRLFVDVVMSELRIPAGQNPVRRPVFLKPHGCAYGTFEIKPDLPNELRIGVFQYDSFPAWVRFSSDTLPYYRDDLKWTVGFAIKLFGVPGRKILETEEDANTQDFVLQNHDVFFVDTANDMCEFTCAGVQKHDYQSYLDAHPKTQQILEDMKKVVSSVLLTDYWSGLPYTFGQEQYVKYKVQPGVASGSGVLPEAQQNNPNYLRDDLKSRLLQEATSFEFYVQLRTDPETMPLDQATVRWDESVSTPIHLATLTLPKQDIDAPGQEAYGENLSCTAWHTLPEHTPVGSISEARKVVYKASADLRRHRNGVPLGEPSLPRHLLSLQPS